MIQLSTSRFRCEVFSWRKHAATKQFLAEAMADLLRPVHPIRFAYAKKVPRIFVRSEPQVVQAKKHHARRPVRPFERRLPCQREIRHPLIEPRAKIRPPQELSRVLPFQLRKTAFRLQHLTRTPVDFPPAVQCKLRL